MSRLGDSLGFYAALNKANRGYRLMALTLDILTSVVGIGTKFALRLLFHTMESNCHGGQTADRTKSITIY